MAQVDAGRGKLSNSSTDSTVKDFFSLLKPRVMFLVVFSSLVGLLVAPNKVHPLISFTAIICITLGSGAAAIFNMWYDSDIDAIMERTKQRAIPRGIISRETAFQFGATLAVISVTIMGLVVNILSAALLAFSIFFYAVIYTIWLKRATTSNIVIGGAAGAMPPVIGWAAACNNITYESLSLFLIIFLWTPPHFWALSLKIMDEYKKVNVPMLPVIKGVTYTKKQIILYSVLMVISTYLLYFTGLNGVAYLSIATILNIIFLYLSYKVYNSLNPKIYMILFSYSIIYLFILLSIVVIDHIFWI
jgi:protoheme IX farnesyltransferase